MGRGSENKLPSAVFAALPKDPDQQLEVAQQITQFAVSGRVAKLEAETSSLRSTVTEKEAIIGSLQARLFGAETSLAETTAKLAVALEGQAKLVEDKDILSGQVKKLMCQVGKLDDFKKALMKTLEASSECGDLAEENTPCPPASPCGSSPPSPMSKSPAPPPSSERKQEGPFSCKKPVCPECPESSPEPSNAEKFVGPDETSEETKSPWVDGKEFFRQARNRLSYEQFNDFLTNIKELNAHRQSQEETKMKSSVIFGPDNFDLNEKLAALLSRYVTSPLP